MTQSCLIIILIFLTLGSACGQIKEEPCKCPENSNAGTEPDTTFNFTNGNSVVLCGYRNKGSKPVTFSEFVLAGCGQDSLIDFWDATMTCRLKVNKDTLVIEELLNLPVGKNLEYQEAVWTIEKVYFKDQKVIKKLDLNQKIATYNKADITAVLNSYKEAKPGLEEDKMELANRLFIASISGSKTARKYFKEFENKFGELDGAFAEEYKDLTAMLALWESKK